MKLEDIEYNVKKWIGDNSKMLEERITNVISDQNKRILELEKKTFLLEEPYLVELLTRFDYNLEEYVVFDRYCEKKYTSEDMEERKFFKYYVAKNNKGKTIEFIESDFVGIKLK